MSLHKECVSGVKHEGTAEGNIVKMGNWDVYVALPKGDYPKDKAILFFTDVFGVQLINNQLMADDFAKNGFQVYMPDYFKGDPIPEDALTNPDRKFDRESWMKNHNADTAWPAVREVMESLKGKGITGFGAVGFCFGAPFVMTLAQENAIKAGVFTHPSRLKVPDDLNTLLEKSSVPVLFNTCEVDQAFPIESQAKADELLGDGKYKPGYLRTYWKGCTHGFAVRGDISKPEIKAGKEGAFKATAEFFMVNV
ncbi:alpha/beta-hydrolase [Schizopora paradoxa]|uniref:Alpha/beta-hydrolase n=1 Tax=Schizopora paradoxa TaxID=27342 RepID=A0A0H2RB74_9AGAM|nr:alpha/beta-hydrolase [Schizopora paradoxa]